MGIDSPLPSQPSARKQEEAPGPGSTVEDVAYWEGLEHTDEFRQLVTARMRFVLPATVFFLVYYFLLPLSRLASCGPLSSVISTSLTCSRSRSS